MLRKKILITGGAGYIGSQTVRILAGRGHKITVLDSLERGHHQALEGLDLHLEIFDLSDKTKTARLIRRGAFDVVIHFAAYAYIEESVRNPLLYYNNNTANGINLLQAMKESDCRKLIFSSSCAVYGNAKKLPITEDHPENPVNPYGKSKLMMEFMIRDSAAAWGLTGICLRYFNASGSDPQGDHGEDHTPEPHLIPNLLMAARDGTVFNLYGTDYPTEDGTCIRDYIHVNDLAEAHCRALDYSPEKPGKYVFNLGTGKGTSIKEMIRTAEKVTQKPIHISNKPGRPGDPPVLYADPQKAEKELNWKAKHRNIENIIRSAWNWINSPGKGHYH